MPEASLIGVVSDRPCRHVTTMLVELAHMPNNLHAAIRSVGALR